MRAANFQTAFHAKLVPSLNLRIFRRLGRASSIVIFAALPALALIAASPRPRKPNPSQKSPSSPAISNAPFHAGEDLNYTVQWFSITDALAARLTVVGEQNFFGEPAWHVQAQTHTGNLLRNIFIADDQFDSYASRMDLTGIQFEMHMHQQGKEESHIYRLSSVSSPAPDEATQVQVLPNTRDALGFTYYLRTVNWDQTEEVRAPVFDGRKIYEVRARVTTPRAQISVRAGKFNATGIELLVYDLGTELTQTRLTVWIAQDSAHTPVLIEVELPIGTGRVELVSAVAAG